VLQPLLERAGPVLQSSGNALAMARLVRAAQQQQSEGRDDEDPGRVSELL
jgi:hypothetical protein